MIVQYKDPPISYDKVTNRRKVSQTHFHYQHELYYLVSGETKYFVGDDIFHLHTGDFIFVPREVIHKTDSESCLQNERILISFEDSIVAAEYRDVLEELGRIKLIRISPNKRYQVEELLHKLEKEEKRTDGYRQMLTGLYIMELLTLLCRYKTAETLPETESEKQISAITEHIRSNYGQELSLGALSRRFGLSESCLCRKFKAVTGMGLNEYITNVRIHNAAQLLAAGDLTVTEVANRCGYADSNYFASVFKKIKGTTPLKFSRSQN